MPGRRRSRGARAEHNSRYQLGQHFLTDEHVIQRAVETIAPRPGELIVDVGAGTGALTIPLLRAGARVIAVERDHRVAQRLRRRLQPLANRDDARVVICDFRRFRFPREPYRVVSNPPFVHTTELFETLFDDPERGPRRADLLVEHHVALKRTVVPASSLRSASWMPWWNFERGVIVRRSAFSPPPTVDAMWVTVTRRDPPLLPARLALGFAESLRDAWAGIH